MPVVSMLQLQLAPPFVLLVYAANAYQRIQCGRRRRIDHERLTSP